MKVFYSHCLFIIILLFVSFAVQIHAAETRTCVSRKSRCFLKRITCPAECPSTKPNDPKAKVCYINCYSPICKAECKHRKPNCNAPGAACLDPRFIGGDGVVFYFHGKSNEHFGLVSDLNLQINARFNGLRPAGRTRDYTWIQALGLLFDSHAFSLEAIPAATWDEEADHLKFTYDGKELLIPEGHFSSWESQEKSIMAERTSEKNSILVTLPEIAEISVNVVVVPVTNEDDRIHNYQIPSDNCFAHLEVQFRFYGLSSEVEGVLGRTYQPDFPAGLPKPCKARRSNASSRRRRQIQNIITSVCRLQVLYILSGWSSRANRYIGDEFWHNRLHQRSLQWARNSLQEISTNFLAHSRKIYRKVLLLK